MKTVMQWLYGLIQWCLAGLTLTFFLAGLNQPLALLSFVLALVAIVPPLLHFWKNRLPLLGQWWARLILWFLLVSVGMSIVGNHSTEKLADRFTQEKSLPELITLLQKPGNSQQPAAIALGRKGNPQAVEPLLTAFQAAPLNSAVRTVIATSLGQLQDVRAFDPLVMFVKTNAEVADLKETTDTAKAAIAQITLKHPAQVEKFLPAFKKGDESAILILQSMGPPVTTPMLPFLKDENALVRLNAALVLAEAGDKQAITPLVANLRDWYSNWAAGKGLQRLGWQPQTDADKVHFMIAMKQSEALKSLGKTVQTVLLQDVQSTDPNTINYGLYAFISLGDRSILPTLTQLLQDKGDETLALAYLNCGEETLEKAAETWAADRRLKVVKTKERVNTVQWGRL